MSIKMVREPSETPNITNIDDIVPFRYAYGNQNGYVKDRGSEISYSINGSQFTVNSGRLVLQGVECDISASGVTLTIDSVAELRYYVAYLQVNLALNTVTILTAYDTVTYPTISRGDDLTELPTGTANLPLYKFTANGGVISNVEKIVNEINYINETTKVNNSFNSDNSNLVQNIDFSDDNKAIFGDYIVSKKKLVGNANFTFTLPANSTEATSSQVSLISYPFLRFEPDKQYTIEFSINASQSDLPSSIKHLSKPSKCYISSSSYGGFTISFQGIDDGFPFSGYPYVYNIVFSQYATGDVLNEIRCRIITFNNTKSTNDQYIHIVGIYEIKE